MFFYFLPKSVPEFLPILWFPISGYGWYRCFPATIFLPVQSTGRVLLFPGFGEFGLALLLSHPADGIRAVTVNGHIETFLFSNANPCTMARNSPILFVPFIGRNEKSRRLAMCTPRYSIGPGLPLQAASTARLLSITQEGKVSEEGLGPPRFSLCILADISIGRHCQRAFRFFARIK